MKVRHLIYVYILHLKFKIMNKNILLAAICITTISLNLFSQDKEIIKNWSENTAFTIPAKKWESGFTQALRIGVSDKVELRSSIFLPIFPVLGAKISVAELSGWNLATEHSLSYPTIFLNAIKMKGILGLIPDQFDDFSPIIGIRNTVTGTKIIGDNSVFSASAGLSFAIRGEKPDYHSTIDFPLAYQRMAHYYSGANISLDASFKLKLFRNLFCEESLNTYFITRAADNVFAENRGVVLWKINRSLGLKVGYVLSYGTYPFGNHWQLWPSIDLILGSKK